MPDQPTLVKRSLLLTEAQDQAIVRAMTAATLAGAHVSYARVAREIVALGLSMTPFAPDTDITAEPAATITGTHPN